MAQVLRWESPHSQKRVSDPLAVEEPLELRVDTQAVTVTMRTPGHDEELALGFLLAEGWIRSFSDVLGVRHSPRNRDGNVLEVVLADSVPAHPKGKLRQGITSSSCGLCGTTSIGALRRRFPPIRSTLKIGTDTLLALPRAMRAGQAHFEATGGLHAAALFDRAGNLLVLREDIGRHNAVDKVVGWAWKEGRLPLSENILLVSGRTSFEILQKALAAGLPLVASVSAPSSLAVEFARKNRQTLVGFLRDGRFNVYSGPSRIRFPRRAP